MAVKYIFADEAGDFTFKNKQGASKYFLLCTLTTDDCALSHELLHIRRGLCASGDPDRTLLHASEDLQAVRDAVFQALRNHQFRVDVTLLEKAKAQPQTRTSDATFYQYAWYYHFKHVGPQILKDAEKLLITAAALGHKKTKAAFKNAVNNTVQQIVSRDKWEIAFMDLALDPMLWAVDYCAWAIQRKWEANDPRSYVLIAHTISTEFGLWRFGQTRYY